MKYKTYKDWALLIARIFIGSLFIMTAYGKFSGMEGTIAYVANTSLPAPALMAWAGAIVELLGGLMLILGFHPNIAAIGLAIYLAIVSFLFHFHPSDQQQMTQFLKNFAIIGGLLFAFFCGAGKYRVFNCKCCQDSSCTCDL